VRFLLMALVVFAICCASCSHKKYEQSPQLIDSTGMEKLDSAMKKKIRELSKADKLEEQVNFIGKYVGISEDELRQKMTDSGGKIHTVTASTFTAECSASALLQLINSESITYVELSQKKYLKE